MGEKAARASFSCRVAALALAASAFHSAILTLAFAQGHAASEVDIARRSAVQATIRDYDARLSALLHQSVSKWESDFLTRRRPQARAVASAMAVLAAEIRDREEINWAAVGQTAEFKAEAHKRIATAIEPEVIQRELVLWAQGVERDTRVEMIRCLQQVVAWDLGFRFDEKLRGQVEAAVMEIPVQTLIDQGLQSADLVKAIQDGLPGVVLTEYQRAAISEVAAELAVLAAKAMARSAPTQPELVALVEVPAVREAIRAAARWSSAKALEGFDRYVTGEPQPQVIEENVMHVLGAWNESELSPELQRILADFRFDVVDFLYSETQTIMIQHPRLN